MQIWTIEEITSSSQCRYLASGFMYNNDTKIAEFTCNHQDSIASKSRYNCRKENCPLKVAK